jgi:ribosomal protein L37AE/L43A
MGRHFSWVASAVITLAAGQASAHGNPAYPGSDTQQTLVRCESAGSRRTFCRANVEGGVRVARQLSRRSCIQGRNWSYTRSGIWVTQGCRADFAVDQSYGSSSGDPVVRDDHYVDQSGRIIHCESTANGRRYCGESHRHYTMSGNSDPNCIEGQTWGRDSRGVWVSGDCNADFNESPYQNDDPYNNSYRNNAYSNNVPDNMEVGHTHTVDQSGRLVHCQSTADGRTYCGDRDNPYIISGARDPDCIEGQTYGRDERGTWVSGNCTADFSVEGQQDHDH